MSAAALPPAASGALPGPPRIGDNERLSATVVFSLLLHGLLVLGVGFALDDAAPVLPTLVPASGCQVKGRPTCDSTGC